MADIKLDMPSYAEVKQMVDEGGWLDYGMILIVLGGLAVIFDVLSTVSQYVTDFFSWFENLMTGEITQLTSYGFIDHFPLALAAIVAVFAIALLTNRTHEKSLTGQEQASIVLMSVAVILFVATEFHSTIVAGGAYSIGWSVAVILAYAGVMVE